MRWIVILDPDFEGWLHGLEQDIHDKILANVKALEQLGPALGIPRVDTLKGSYYPNMKELRIQHNGEPWRVLFAFDFERRAILLVGGNKQANKRWYDENIPIAEARFKKHLLQLKGKKYGKDT